MFENSKHNNSFAISVADLKMETWLVVVRRKGKFWHHTGKEELKSKEDNRRFSIRNKNEGALGIHTFFLMTNI